VLGRKVEVHGRSVTRDIHRDGDCWRAPCLDPRGNPAAFERAAMTGANAWSRLLSPRPRSPIWLRQRPVSRVPRRLSRPSSSRGACATSRLTRGGAGPTAAPRPGDSDQALPIRWATSEAAASNALHRPSATAMGLWARARAPSAHTRRGLRRGQKARNQPAPAFTEADSREANGADTEIRTQDLLFTKQLHSSRPRESKRQSSRLESHAGTTSMACRGPTTRSGSGHDIGPGRPAADRSGAAALVADAGVSGTSRGSAPCPRGPWTIRRRSRPTVALLEIRATMRPCTQKRRVRAAMTSFAAPSAASPGPGDPRAPDASSPPS